MGCATDRVVRRVPPGKATFASSGGLRPPQQVQGLPVGPWHTVQGLDQGTDFIHLGDFVKR